LPLLAQPTTINIIKDEITLMDCSRKPAFIAHCLKVAQCSKLKLRTTITLLKPPKRNAKEDKPPTSKTVVGV